MACYIYLILFTCILCRLVCNSEARPLLQAEGHAGCSARTEAEAVEAGDAGLVWNKALPAVDGAVHPQEAVYVVCCLALLYLLL